MTFFLLVPVAFPRVRHALVRALALELVSLARVGGLGAVSLVGAILERKER